MKRMEVEVCAELEAFVLSKVGTTDCPDASAVVQSALWLMMKLDRQVIRLRPEDANFVSRLLDNPPPPTPALFEGARSFNLQVLDGKH